MTTLEHLSIELGRFNPHTPLRLTVYDHDGESLTLQLSIMRGNLHVYTTSAQYTAEDLDRSEGGVPLYDQATIMQSLMDQLRQKIVDGDPRHLDESLSARAVVALGKNWDRLTRAEFRGR